MFDRTASNMRVPKKDIAGMFRVGLAMYVPVLTFAAIIGAAVTSGPGGASETLSVLMGLFVGAIGFRVLFLFILTRRVGRFVNRDPPRLLAAIDTHDRTVAVLTA